MQLNDILSVLDTVRRAVSAEDYAKIADISNAYFQAVSENFELKEENYRLKTELNRLRDEAGFMKKLKNRRGAYYAEDDEGNEVGPVCPSCYRDGIVSELVSITSGGSMCFRCKEEYPSIKGVSVPPPPAMNPISF